MVRSLLRVGRFDLIGGASRIWVRVFLILRQSMGRGWGERPLLPQIWCYWFVAFWKGSSSLWSTTNNDLVPSSGNGANWPASISDEDGSSSYDDPRKLGVHTNLGDPSNHNSLGAQSSLGSALGLSVRLPIPWSKGSWVLVWVSYLGSRWKAWSVGFNCSPRFNKIKNQSKINKELVWSRTWNEAI